MKPYVFFSAAALATALLVSQAAAQTPAPTDPGQTTEKRSIEDRKSDAQTAAEQQADTSATTSATTQMNSDAMAVASATAEPAVVTNGPVLDTAENRAKYPPMSRAGKRTAARGN